MFCVGWCNASCLGFFEQQLNNCFWKIRVVQKRTVCLDGLSGGGCVILNREKMAIFSI